MPGKDRSVRVVTVTQDYFDRTDAPRLANETLERLEFASAYRPDIACLPEHFAGNAAEPVPGPATERVGRWAKEHSCWAICPILATAGAGRHNAAVLIDRQGRIAGQYDKIHPTEGELKGGTRPGDLDPPVFTTDFGTIGIQICFDVNWWEPWAALKRKGAEIVFWPSAYPAARQLSALAWRNEFFVVSSTMTRGSRIFDITGDVIDMSGMFRPWAQATIQLGKRLFEIDYHVGKMREVEKKYGPRVQVQWYHDEDWFTLASVDPNLSVEEIVAEFGLVPKRQYHARCEAAMDAARK